MAPLCTGEGSTSSIAARVATSYSSQSLKMIDNLVELRRVQCTQYIGMLLSITSMLQKAEYFHLKSVTKNLKQFLYDALIKHAWQYVEIMLPNNFDLDLQYLDL